VFFEIPLDLEFCSVFTNPRSGERNANRGGEEGLRPGPHRQRGESGTGTWTVFTGHLKPGSRTPSGEREQRRVGVGAGNCIGVRIKPGSPTPSGEGGQRRSVSAVE